VTKRNRLISGAWNGAADEQKLVFASTTVQ